MRITFVFASWSPTPSGGYRVIYKYAKILGDRGHEVFVIHPLWILPKQSGLTGKLKEVTRWVKHSRSRNYNQFFWIKIFVRLRSFFKLILLRKDKNSWNGILLGQGIQTRIVPTLAEKHIPRADAIFATDLRTAKWVADYGLDRGEKYYSIQNFERWSAPEEDRLSTWKLPLKKIVVSKRLKEELSNLGEKIYGYIPNAIDFKEFYLKEPIETRNPKRIGMLYHFSPSKGSQDGIKAVRIVKTQYPELEVVFFSAYKYNKKVIPPWVEFHHTPSQEEILEIYNACSIFVSPSWSEAWCLSSAEAMACGCALVSTKGGSVEEYAIDGETALISEDHDPLGLAENIVRLIENQTLRIRLAIQGNNLIRQFTWEKSVAELERVLLNKNYTH